MYDGTNRKYDRLTKSPSVYKVFWCGAQVRYCVTHNLMTQLSLSVVCTSPMGVNSVVKRGNVVEDMRVGSVNLGICLLGLFLFVGFILGVSSARPTSYAYKVINMEARNEGD